MLSDSPEANHLRIQGVFMGLDIHEIYLPEHSGDSRSITNGRTGSFSTEMHGVGLLGTDNAGCSLSEKLSYSITGHIMCKFVKKVYLPLKLRNVYTVTYDGDRTIKKVPNHVVVRQHDDLPISLSQ